MSHLGDILWRITFNPYTRDPEITFWRVIGVQSNSFGNTEYVIRNTDYQRDDTVLEQDIGIYAHRIRDEAVEEMRRFLS